MKSANLILLYCILMLSCSKTEIESSKAERKNIHPDFIKYVERFEEEAKLRGITLNADDMTNLVVEYSTEPANRKACGLGYFNTPKVQIDGTCWNGTDAEKERLMFHELGHTILKRQHINTILPNGDIKSIMFNRSGGYSYSSLERKYYVDELFNPNVSAPSWANIPTQTITLFSDSISKENKWIFDEANPAMQGKIDDKLYSSKPYSFAIINNGLSFTSAEYASWRSTKWVAPYETLGTSELSRAAKVALKVKVRAVGNHGKIVLSLLKEDGSNTENEIDISPTNTFEEYILGFRYFPNQINTFTIRLGAIVGANGGIY